MGVILLKVGIAILPDSCLSKQQSTRVYIITIPRPLSYITALPCVIVNTHQQIENRRAWNKAISFNQGVMTSSFVSLQDIIEKFIYLSKFTNVSQFQTLHYSMLIAIIIAIRIDFLITCVLISL